MGGAGTVITEKIVSGGAGQFLDPPNYPTHFRHVATDCNRHKVNRGSMSLTYAIDCNWLPIELRSRCKSIIASWHERNPVFDRDNAEMLDWMHSVLGYFRNCWLDPRLIDNGPGGREFARKCDNLIIDPEDTPQDITLMRGVDHVREFFPDFTPTDQDFAEAYWGSK